MHKKYLVSLIILIAIVITLIVTKPFSPKEGIQNEVSIKDHKNISYVIDGQSITLNDGISEIESAPGSVTKIVTRYFGNEIKYDLNNDGRDDVAFLITQERGGSGQFFYVVAALTTQTEYIGSHAYLLGDRIAPQSISVDEATTTQGTIRENVIVVNFATRKPNEPMATQPSVGKSVWIKFDTTSLKFGEVAQDFEGESR